MLQNFTLNLRLIDRYKYWMDSKFFTNINLQETFFVFKKDATQSNPFLPITSVLKSSNNVSSEPN